MSLLVTEINEMRQMLNNYDSGTLSAEDFNTKLNAYSQIEKRERLLLQAWALAIKNGMSGNGSHIVKQLVGKKTVNLKPTLKSRTADRGR